MCIFAYQGGCDSMKFPVDQQLMKHQHATFTSPPVISATSAHRNAQLEARDWRMGYLWLQAT